MRIVTLLMASLTLLVSVAATAAVDVEPGEYVVFYHHDVLGSPVTATNEQGQVIWHERTESYGKSEGRVSQSGNAFGDNALPAGNSRQGYTGHTLDNSAGLTYMKARYYDHNIGRFLSNDPVGFSTDKPMMFNRYAYVYNNPYGHVDPDGRQGVDLNDDDDFDGIPDTLDRDHEYNMVTPLSPRSSDPNVPNNYAIGAGATPKKRGPSTNKNAPHNKKIREIGDRIVEKHGETSIIAGGGRQREILIRTPRGLKSGRRPDIIYVDAKGNTRAINVGKTNADNMTPIKREREAMSDLRAEGITIKFIRYD